MKISTAQEFGPDSLLAIQETGVSRSAIKKSDMFLSGREVNLVTLPNVLKHREPLRQMSSGGGGGGVDVAVHSAENTRNRRENRKSVQLRKQRNIQILSLNTLQ
jgi:hypothetical protein